MSVKKILTIVGFALVATVLYWLHAEFDISFSKYASTSSDKDVDFNWGTCALWAVIGAVIGAVPVGSKNKSGK